MEEKAEAAPCGPNRYPKISSFITIPHSPSGEDVAITRPSPALGFRQMRITLKLVCRVSQRCRCKSTSNSSFLAAAATETWSWSLTFPSRAASLTCVKQDLPRFPRRVGIVWHVARKKECRSILCDEGGPFQQF